MRKIVAGEYMTLDGVVDAGWEGQQPAVAPGDSVTGAYFDDELNAAVSGMIVTTDALLLGRVTYQGFAAFFSGQTGDVADQMNSATKYVVSTTLTTANWQNTTIISRNILDAIADLKRQPGENIGVSGSATLTRSLVRAGLIDELHLFVLPVILGRGKRLFGDEGAPATLKLSGSQVFGSGVVHLTYAPADQASN